MFAKTLSSGDVYGRVCMSADVAEDAERLQLSGRFEVAWAGIGALCARMRAPSSFQTTSNAYHRSVPILYGMFEDICLPVAAFAMNAR